jgi:hypothetical protein
MKEKEAVENAMLEITYRFGSLEANQGG